MSKSLCIRYVVAGVVSCMASILAVIVLYMATGVDKGPGMLSVDSWVAFFGVATGGFCFPSKSRWMRSFILLLIGLLLYCVTWGRPDDGNLILLWPLSRGGLAAVFLHVVIDAIHLARKQPSEVVHATVATNTP